MPRSRSSLAVAFGLAAAIGLAPAGAFAQFGGAPGGGGGMRPMGPGSGGQQQGPEEKEQQVEAAPEATGQEPAFQPLPAWPGQREKQLQFLQLSGYMRGRGYFMNKFHLGIIEGSSGPRPPFFPPYSEFNSGGIVGQSPDASCAGRDKKACRADNLFSSDMRLRLEPTINVSEQVRVKAQIDVFDNLVFGSTPEGYWLSGLGPSADVPLQAFTRSQQTAETGRNSFENSIRVKRAWAEVRTPIGELRFGRMPSHWGMGVLVNGGDCLDCDYGVNADRVMFATKFKQHFGVLLFDWVATGPTTRLYTPNQQGPAFNADPLDDVSQIGLALGRNDKPEEIKERLEKGEVVLNYGGYFVYRWQNWDQITNPGQNTGGVLGGATSPQALQKNLTARGAWAFIPDLWLRLNYRRYYLELEAAMIGGHINTVSDQISSANKPLDILSWGGVFRTGYSLLRDSLHLQLEVGTASGDQAEDPNAVVNYRLAKLVRPTGQRFISNFNFDPDYHVDLILFRRILGTVSNATYFKPSIWYDIIDALSARVDVIYSIANRPVAYPGNSFNLGLEIDGAVMYKNEKEGFYAGVFYGVLFPKLGDQSALSIPGEIYGAQFKQDADVAQTLQARLVVKF